MATMVRLITQLPASAKRRKVGDKKCQELAGLRLVL